MALSSVHGNLFAVGDPNQAIYGFQRGECRYNDGDAPVRWVIFSAADRQLSLPGADSDGSQCPGLHITTVARVANQEGETPRWSSHAAVYEAVNESRLSFTKPRILKDLCRAFD